MQFWSQLEGKLICCWFQLSSLTDILKSDPSTRLSIPLICILFELDCKFFMHTETVMQSDGSKILSALCFCQHERGF